MRRTGVAAIAAAALAVPLTSPGIASAAVVTPVASSLRDGAPAGTPVLVPSMTKPPSGYRLTGAQVLAIAKKNQTVIFALRGEPGLIPYVYTKGNGTWQVSWFTKPPEQKERVQVYVNDQLAEVTQAWTGYQVQWTMARGYPGAFGRRANALFVWLPLCGLFFLPFFPWRRRPTLLHLDLLMLLGLSISLAFFNHADLGLSVPLVYPFMIYLLVRLLALARGIGLPREPLRLALPPSWLAVGLVFLVGFRIGLNVTNSNVIDVGYAGVIGADKIIHGTKLYGNWPSDNPAGDTYAPFNYAVYVPFRAIFGWSGVWDSLPAAHAAAITFDLLTMLGLFLLGRSIRGPTLGITFAYAWAAYPFTLFTLSSNSNDALVALMLVITLLLLRWPAARGISATLAGLTKFAPLALGPLFLRGVGPVPRPREIVKYVLAYALTFAAVMAPIVLNHNLSAFWKDTISYQSSRPAPFSIWGLWGHLKVLQRIVQGAAAGLAVVVAFVPRRRGVVEVAALGGAVLIALQLGITYWFYLYIVWFLPLVIVALLGAQPRAIAALERLQEETLERAQPA